MEYSKAKSTLVNLRNCPERLHCSFFVEAAPKDRIDFIFAVIAPGFRRLSFLIKYVLLKLAYTCDISSVKIILYRLCGMKIGSGVFISPGVDIDPHFPELIEIGDYAVIGWRAVLATHEYDGRKYHAGRVKIGREAIIGAFAKIRCGNIIPDKAVVNWEETIKPLAFRKRWGK